MLTAICYVTGVLGLLGWFIVAAIILKADDLEGEPLAIGIGIQALVMTPIFTVGLVPICGLFRWWYLGLPVISFFGSIVVVVVQFSKANSLVALLRRAEFGEPDRRIAAISALASAHADQRVKSAFKKAIYANATAVDREVSDAACIVALKTDNKELINAALDRFIKQERQPSAALLKTIGMHKDPRVVRKLGVILRSYSIGDIAVNAAMALAMVGGPEAEVELIAALEQRGSREAAAAALTSLKWEPSNNKEKVLFGLGTKAYTRVAALDEGLEALADELRYLGGQSRTPPAAFYDVFRAIKCIRNEQTWEVLQSALNYDAGLIEQMIPLNPSKALQFILSGVKVHNLSSIEQEQAIRLIKNYGNQLSKNELTLVAKLPDIPKRYVGEDWEGWMEVPAVSLQLVRDTARQALQKANSAAH